MKPGQSIEIQLETSPGNPLELGNVLLEIHLFTRGTFRYGFQAGRTDNNGRLNITYLSLENLRAANAKQFLMDYNTPLVDCDPTVEILAPSEEELRDASDSVLRSYGRRPDWLPTGPQTNR